MTSSLVVLFACLQVLSIVASSGNVSSDNCSIEGLLKSDGSPEERKELRTSLDDRKDEIKRKIEDYTNLCKSRRYQSEDSETSCFTKVPLRKEVNMSLHDLKDEIKRKIEHSKASTHLYETKRDQSENSETPWFTKIPQLPVVYAMSSSLPDGPCKKQAQRYIRDLKNGTLWATQMYDASTKYPDGLISGYTRHFGDFDGCYNLEAKLTHYDDDDLAIDEEISGRYCLVDIKYDKQSLPPVNPDKRLDLVFDPNDSVWEAIREKGDIRRKERYKLRMALCVPEVCSHSDIEAALQEPLKSFGAEQNLNLNISVKPYFCQARKDVPEFSQGAKIYCSIVAGLIALVIISTCYDFKSKDDRENVDPIARDLILCFSARRNFNTIMEPTSGHRGLETIHLIRSVWMTFTMIGHRTSLYWFGVLTNPNYIEWIQTYRLSMVVFAGPHIVEGFFGLGGLLMSYSLLDELDAKKKMNFLGLVFIRFLRLTPSYMLVVFFHALVMPHIGSGPYWEWKVGSQRDSCSNNWWTNLLYINNYVKPEQICLFQSWYLSVDYHLFVIALIVTYLFWRMPRKYGYLFLCAIIIAGCIVPFINTYVYGVQPMYIGYLRLEDVREDPYFTGHYVTTHERITSYFIGVLVGAVLYDHSRAPWQLGKVSSNILFILLAVVFSLGSQLLGHKYYDPNVKPTRLESAIYASLYRGAFAISTCAIPLLITIGTGLTFHYNFLTPRWCQPLARVTYGMYLVHATIQLYGAAVSRTPKTFAIYRVFWNYVPDVFFAFGVSLVLALIVEGPFRQIEKRFIMKREKRVQMNGMKKEAKKTN